MPYMSEQYGMNTFKSSEDYKLALRDLRKKLGIVQRAERRLSNAPTVHRKRTTKTTKNGTQGSAAPGTGGGHSDREDRTTNLQPSES